LPSADFRRPHHGRTTQDAKNVTSPHLITSLARAVLQIPAAARLVATNVRGVFVAIQASCPHLREGGRMITIGSNTAGRTALPGASVYSMAKGAVASLVQASLSTSRRAGLPSSRTIDGCYLA
jgi:NAD(P)-dependent dehydrogenase (short-subunit alcohol dehydrogenase family)